MCYSANFRNGQILEMGQDEQVDEEVQKVEVKVSKQASKLIQELNEESELAGWESAVMMMVIVEDVGKVIVLVMVVDEKVDLGVHQVGEEVTREVGKMIQELNDRLELMAVIKLVAVQVVEEVLVVIEVAMRVGPNFLK